MADSRLVPDYVPPPSGRKKVLGGIFLLLASLAGFPVFSQMRRDGLSRVSEWPDAFFLFGVICAVLIGIGIALIVSRKIVGGSLRFHVDGFTVHVRGFFSDHKRRFDWADLREIVLTEVQNLSDFTFRPKEGTSFRVMTSAFSISRREVLDRLHASAQVAGYRLEKAGGYDVLVAGKTTWVVVPA